MEKPVISPKAHVAENATIRGNVTVEAGASIWYGAVLRAEMASITIGKDSNIQDNCVVHVDYGYPVTVGEGVTVGHAAILHGCTIGDHCLIGMGAIIMNGAVVGKESLIGAGALVTERTVIPEGSMAFGNPARVIRALTAEERAKLLKAAQFYTAESGELDEK